jgi:hypothetical protein
MSADDFKAAEAKRQELLAQLNAAETAIRSGIPSQGFGATVQAHLERALAHVREAYIAVNEAKSVRTVQQLVDDLNRVQQVVDEAKRGKSHRI